MSSLCLTGVRVTLAFFVPRAWGHSLTRVICRCSTKQWMSTEKIGSMVLLCRRKQQDNNIALCLSEKEVCVVSSGFIHSTPKCGLRFYTFPDHTSTEPISSLGLAERLSSRAAQLEEKGQSRCLWLCGRELRNWFRLIEFLKTLDSDVCHHDALCQCL